MIAPARLAAFAFAVSAVYGACFYYRLDYPAHVLAGFGACGLCWTLASRSIRPPGIRATLSIAAVAGLAVLGELTLFGPQFDTIDVANTLMGAALGAAALAGSTPRLARPEWLQQAMLAATSGALIVLGLLIRYPIQEATSQWWFGR